MMQDSVQPGAWRGERGCVQISGLKWLGDDFSGPRSLFIESHPWRPRSSPSSRAAQSQVSLAELSISDQAVPDSSSWWGTEARPPSKMPVSDPNKL